MQSPKHDVYTTFHKLLRSRLFETSMRLGAADFVSDGAPGGGAEALAFLRETLADLASHASVEEAHIHPILRAQAPAVARTLDSGARVARRRHRDPRGHRRRARVGAGGDPRRPRAEALPVLQRLRRGAGEPHGQRGARVERRALGAPVRRTDRGAPPAHPGLRSPRRRPAALRGPAAPGEPHGARRDVASSPGARRRARSLRPASASFAKEARRNIMRALAAAAVTFLPAWLLSCSVTTPSAPGTLVAPTVDDDATLPALDVNGTRLHVETRGPAGAPVRPHRPSGAHARALCGRRAGRGRRPVRRVGERPALRARDRVPLAGGWEQTGALDFFPPLYCGIEVAWVLRQ